MKPPVRALAVLAFVGSLSVACTSSPANPSADGTPKPTTPSPTDTGRVESVPGEYSYENAGVQARFKYQTGGGQLTVSNKSGQEIAGPGIYLLAADDGHRVAGTVENSEPVGNGDSKEFSVTFASPVPPDNVGMIFLLIGHSNYGGFVPPAPSK